MTNHKLPTLVFIIISLLLCGFLIKGQVSPNGTLYFQTDHNSQIGGPFEASNTNSRYALTEAIVNEGKFYFSDAQARLASPDLVNFNNKYFSIFTPGISFLGVPFYALGQLFGLPQLFTFLSTTLVAIINVYLISKIAQRLGASQLAGLLGGFIFLFATNALSYSLTFTQHHTSVLLICLGILNLFEPRTVKSNISLGMIYGLGLLIDIPNAFLIFPILLVAFIHHFLIAHSGTTIKVSLRPTFLAIIVGLIPLLILFGWYNKDLTGSPFKLGQNIGRSIYPPDSEPKISDKNLSLSEDQKVVSTIDFKPFLKTPFKTRKQAEGAFILLFGKERGWLYYSPILFLGVVGLILALRSSSKSVQTIATLSTAIVMVDILIYSMFGDPWGGWAFGPRYLIPAAALMSVFVAYVVEKWKKYWWFTICFLVLAGYSLTINFLGASTTTLIPPQQEAEALSTPTPYTYDLNLKFLKENVTSSLVYNRWLYSSSSVIDFAYTFIIVEFSVVVIAYLFILLGANKKYD